MVEYTMAEHLMSTRLVMRDSILTFRMLPHIIEPDSYCFILNEAIEFRLKQSIEKYKRDTAIVIEQG
jgi:hypothetical protein